MFELIAASDDDRGFVELVSGLIAGAMATHRSIDVLIYKIDNWFDHKWLGFSGKTLGALGVWSRPLTLPPFVSNRIIGEWHYRRHEVGDGYRELGPSPGIHHRGWSARNLHRQVERIVPDSALFWFSGNTAAMGRGSLMAYVPVDDQEHWPWFVALARDGEWRIARRKGIHIYEIRLFQDAASKVQEGKRGE